MRRVAALGRGERGRASGGARSQDRQSGASTGRKATRAPPGWCSRALDLSRRRTRQPREVAARADRAEASKRARTPRSRWKGPTRRRPAAAAALGACRGCGERCRRAAPVSRPARPPAVARPLRAGGPRRLARSAAGTRTPRRGAPAARWSCGGVCGWGRHRLRSSMLSRLVSRVRASHRGRSHPAQPARDGQGEPPIAPRVASARHSEGGMNGSPGSSGASRPASQRRALAPTSASGPSWRRPPWPAKRRAAARTRACGRCPARGSQP